MGIPSVNSHHICYCIFSRQKGEIIMATFINVICAIIGIVIVGAFAVWLFALIYAFIKEKDEGVKMFALCVLGLGLIVTLVSQCAGCEN